jgi:hypothetical protein
MGLFQRSSFETAALKRQELSPGVEKRDFLKERGKAVFLPHIVHN